MWHSPRVIRRALTALSVAAPLVLTPAAVAQTPPAPTLTLSAEQTGWIAARVTAPPATTIALSDVTDAPRALGSQVSGADGALAVPRAAPWDCRGPRRLQASYVDGAGERHVTEATIRTPSCAGRITIRARPSHPRAGRAASVLVTDRWRVGDLKVSVCTAAAVSARRCRTLTLRAGEVRGAVAVRPTRAGRQRITARYAGRRATTTMLVRPRSARLRVLATGDSMIQIVDESLRRRLTARGPVRLTSDAHISTGISKPFMFDWIAHAAASARSVKPDVTVVFLGANDGFPIGSAPCCDALWQARYAKRAARMMRSYARGGRSTVYWLLLPTPRRSSFVDIYRHVNRAVRSAAARFPGLVEVVDLGKVFTPGGRFRQTMGWHGRRLSVRQADGVHLSVAGARIAAEVVQRRMRDDGLVR